ncbi:MAG: hypothetical protein K2N94_06155 [Lachnospiraceae bacterium]|nr:hypothetical protein [Lachnospiraceae bacterium]
MTEELNNFCTELKELFMRQSFPELEEMLSARTDEEIVLLAENQRAVIVKYYEQEKYDMLFAHLNFVAFASYLFEYAGKRGVFSRTEFEKGFEVFLNIYRLLQDTKAQAENSGGTA